MGWIIRKVFWLAFFLFIVYVVSAFWSGGDLSRQVGDATGVQTCYELADKADALKARVNRLLGRTEEKKSDWRDKASGRKRMEKGLAE